MNSQSKSSNNNGAFELLYILLEQFMELTEIEQEQLRAKIRSARFIQCSEKHGRIKIEYCDENYALNTILI